MNNFSRTLDIALSGETSLSSLAKLSGLDPFKFFQRADLRGVDLSKQDLRGLNFDGADLRSAKLNHVKHDEGAFNNSLLSDETVFVDSYDTSFDDFIVISKSSNFWFLVNFRPSTLNTALQYTGLPFYEFSRLAGVNQSTLRKARRGGPVTRASADSILSAIYKIVFSKSSTNRLDRVSLFSLDLPTWQKQPSIELVEASSTGGTKPIHSFIKNYLMEHTDS